ncbi:MAG: undecaprenyldiphospho-muramoylpentapeptide beta-N-acetylglucosaminyltransferase [Bowdeniella nasicola]|nr:undecaprenyldiphospho-muramoylpentapeptide beta-N-acetylglucosaminyltransferase [Bowdeniella nasicola]
MQSVVLAGGGSAGHVNPLLATAAEITRRNPAARLTILGVESGLEASLVPAAGLELTTIPKVPLPRRPSRQMFTFPRSFQRAVGQVRDIIRQVDADIVLGFGGYVATPAYIAARREGVAYGIHEQNARPGYANRYGARHAALVALTFRSSRLAAQRGITEVTGLPLRGPILDLAQRRRSHDGQWARETGAKALGLDPQMRTIVVTGGSLGAQSINDAASVCSKFFQIHGMQVLHLTGRGKADAVRTRVKTNPHYHVLEYLDSMDQAYAVADLVICRSGAGTVAELTALGLPAIYIPLPIGNGEQKENADDVLSAGGGVLLADKDLNAASLQRAITQLTADDDTLRRAGQAAASVGCIDGARRLVDELEKISR